MVKLQVNLSAHALYSVINAYHPGLMQGVNNVQLRASMARSESARAGNLNDGLLKYIIYTEIPDDRL